LQLHRSHRVSADANARLFVADVMVNKYAKFEGARFKDTKLMTEVKSYDYADLSPAALKSF